MCQGTPVGPKAGLPVPTSPDEEVDHNMKTGALQSLWRGFGHSFVLLSTIAFLGFLCAFLFMRSHTGGWMVFLYEVAIGAWHARLLLAVFTINLAILSACCYRIAHDKPVVRLFVSYFLIASLFCIMTAYAEMVVGGIGDIPVDPLKKDRFGGTTVAVGASGPPRLITLLEPICFFVVPLAPLLVLQGFSPTTRTQRDQLNESES